MTWKKNASPELLGPAIKSNMNLKGFVHSILSTQTMYIVFSKILLIAMLDHVQCTPTDSAVECQLIPSISPRSTSKSTLDEHLNRYYTHPYSVKSQPTSSSTLNWQSVESWPNVLKLVHRHRSTLNGLSAKISWLSTKMLIKCWLSVNQCIDRGSIKGIDRHTTADALSMHDPLCLVNLLLII